MTSTCSWAIPVRAIGPGPTVDGEPADHVVVAMPDPQAAELIDAPQVRGRAWRSVLAVAMRWPERIWTPFPAAFVNGHPLLTSIADDGDRRGDGARRPRRARERRHAGRRGRPRSGTCWTCPRRRPCTRGTGRTPRPSTDRDEPFHLGADGISFAGDGWGSSRVETAWRSGHELGRALAERRTAG